MEGKTKAEKVAKGGGREIEAEKFPLAIYKNIIRFIFSSAGSGGKDQGGKVAKGDRTRERGGKIKDQKKGEPSKKA